MDTLGEEELLEGIDAYMNGQADKAYEIFQAVHENNPEIAPPGILIAFLYSNSQQYYHVRKYLEETVEQYPDDPEALYQLAGIAIQEERYLESRLLIEQGNKILAQYQKKREKNPGSGVRLEYLSNLSLRLQANLAEHREKYAEAEQFVRQIITNQPKNETAYLSLGYLLFRQNKITEAREAFDKAHELNSEQMPGWLRLAVFQEQNNETAEAQRLVDENFTGVSLPPEQQAAIINLYLKWNRMVQANEMAETMQTEYPEHPLPWILLGQIALYHSQFKVAEENFRKALLLEPENYEANNGIALALSDQNNKAKLIQARNIAHENYLRYPDSLEATATYAWILFLSGQKDDSDALFSPILEKGEMTSTIAYYLAEIANYRGNPNLAQNLLDVALGQECNFPKKIAAQELLKIVQGEFTDENEESETSGEDETSNSSKDEGLQTDEEVIPDPLTSGSPDQANHQEQENSGKQLSQETPPLPSVENARPEK